MTNKNDLENETTFDVPKNLIWAHIHDHSISKFQNPFDLFHGIVVRSNDISVIEIGPNIAVKKSWRDFIVEPFHWGDCVVFSKEQHQNRFEGAFVLEKWHDFLPDNG